MRFKDEPNCGEAAIAEETKNKIMHIALPIGKSNVLMATDALESMGQKLNIGNNFYISIGTESKEEADKLYNGLSMGGKIEMAIADSP